MRFFGKKNKNQTEKQGLWSGLKRRSKLLAFFDRFQTAEWQESPRVKFLNKYSLLFHALLACILVLAIEWVSRHSLLSALQFSFGTPLTFLYNVFLVFASFLVVYLFKRRAVVRVILTVFWMLLGVINGCILANRVTPFNFTDLKLVGDLLAMKNSKYFTFAQEILVVICLVAVLAFVVLMAIRGRSLPGKYTVSEMRVRLWPVWRRFRS